MILLLWPLNFAISWFNAWACGSTWDSTRARGGVPHFMNWMGAVMSASGFTWCYLIALGMLGSVLPMSLIQDAPEGGIPVEGPILDAATLQAFFDLGYLVIIFPILGSGLALTVQAWRSLARRRAAKTADAMDYVVAGWDTFAQVHNTVGAIRHVPGVLDNLGGFFGGKSSGGSDDAKGTLILIVVLLVVASAFAGILTTYSILQTRRRTIAQEEHYRAMFGEAA